MKKRNSKFSNYLRKISKYHLYIFAIGMPILLISAGTIIINVFWSGTVTPPVAVKNDVVKDYMTIYIAMLGVVATMYGSFVVIYAYGGWKEQHNKLVHSDRTLELINHLKKLNHVLLEIYIPIGHFINYSKKDRLIYPNKDELTKEHYDKFVAALNLIIDNNNNCFMEVNYYLIFLQSKESKELYFKYDEINKRIKEIHDKYKFEYFPHNYEDNPNKFEDLRNLINTFAKIAGVISIEILPNLYKSLRADS